MMPKLPSLPAFLQATRKTSVTTAELDNYHSLWNQLQATYQSGRSSDALTQLSKIEGVYFSSAVIYNLILLLLPSLLPGSAGRWSYLVVF